MEKESSVATALAPRMTARALLLGERIDTGGLERADLVSTAPLAFPTGQAGFVVLYKFGVAVLFGLSPLEEDEVLGQLGARVAGALSRHDDETLVLAAGSGRGGETSRQRPSRGQGLDRAAPFGDRRRAGQKRGSGPRRTTG